MMMFYCNTGNRTKITNWRILAYSIGGQESTLMSTTVYVLIMLFCVFQNSTNITYAELGEFQKEKMPFPPLPLTSVVYASISKQQRSSIQNTKVQHNSIILITVILIFIRKHLKQKPVIHLLLFPKR